MNLIQEWRAVGLFDLRYVAQWVFENLRQCQIFLLSGAVGSGKTTFVKEYLKCCGVSEFEGSPTYHYYNLYPLSHIQKERVLIHVDMYRLPVDDQTFQTEFEDLQLLNSIIFIENYNPQKGMLLNDYLVIYFEEVAVDKRKIWIEGKKI